MDHSSGKGRKRGPYRQYIRDATQLPLKLRKQVQLYNEAMTLGASFHCYCLSDQVQQVDERKLDSQGRPIYGQCGLFGGGVYEASSLEILILVEIQ